ncbi:MAG: hypothetical protein R6X11_04400 [Desulfonatronovibrio sp.]
MTGDSYGRSLSIVHEIRCAGREYVQGFFEDASTGMKNTLEVLSQYLHPLDAQSNTTPPLVMDKT